MKHRCLSVAGVYLMTEIPTEDIAFEKFRNSNVNNIINRRLSQRSKLLMNLRVMKKSFRFVCISFRMEMFIFFSF